MSGGCCERTLNCAAKRWPSKPQSEWNTELAAALASLRPDEREVLLLYAWADLDYEQIGQALNVPVGTVRSRLNRARGRLRDRLQAVPASTGEEALRV